MNLQNKNAIYNILGPVILNGVNFFTIPIFTRLLGPEQYGVVAVYKTWVGIFTILMGLQVQGSIGAATVYLEEKEIPKYLSSTLALGLLFSFVCFIVGSFAAESLAGLLFLTGESLGLMALQSVGMFVVTFSSVAFIFLKKAQFSFLVNVSAAVLGIGCSLYLTMYCFPADRLFLGSMYGTALPVAFIALLAVLYFLHHGSWTLRWSHIRFCLPICLPLIFHGLSHMVLGQSDRVLLQRMVGNADAGIYSFMIIFSNVLVTIWGALNNTWVPFYYDDVKAGRIDAIHEKSRHYIFLYVIILMVFILWAPEVIELFAPKAFWPAISLLPLFVLSNYFTFLYSFPVNFQFYHKTTYTIATGTLLAALLNIGLDLLLIPRWGMAGSAFATLAAHAALFLFHEYIAARVLSAPYHYSLRFFLPGLLAVCSVLAFFVLCRNIILVRWGVGIILSLVFFRDVYRRRRIF